MTYQITWKGNEYTNSSDRGIYKPFIIVDHISAGSLSSMDNWFTDSSNTVSSAHFGVGRKGDIHQYVDIRRMAWANGTTRTNLPSTYAKVVDDMNFKNVNLYSVSIEHEGYDGTLTEEQFAATVWLHKYIREQICEIYGNDMWFELDDYHVIGHYQLSKLKPNCPGINFPWNNLYKALKNNEEDEDNMPMKLESWQWDMLYEVFGKAYNEDKISWDWIQKIVDRTMTATECAWLNTVLDGRIDRKIEV